MKRWWHWAIIGAVALALIAGIGWASTYNPLVIPAATETWSRGRLIGVSPVKVPVSMHPATHGRLNLVWVGLDSSIHLVQIDSDGQVVLDRLPRVGAELPRAPVLLVDSDGGIHLTWQETSRERSVLMYALLDERGAVRTRPAVLSSEADKVRASRLCFNGAGEVEILWEGQAGIYAATVNAAGDVVSDARLLIEGGQDPVVQVDRSGILHLAWIEPGEGRIDRIYYASLDPRAGALGEPEVMAEIFLRTGQLIQSLDLALDGQNGYVVWAIQDLREVTSWVQYAFFPLEIPRQKKVRDLYLEGSTPLSVRALPGQHDVALTVLSEMTFAADEFEFQIGIIPLQGESSQGDQAGAGEIRADVLPAVRGPGQAISSGRSGLGQAIRDLQADWPEDQLVVTASSRSSLRPSLIVDERGYFHLAWLEGGGFGLYQVAYASTAPGVRKEYGSLTLWDVIDPLLSFTVRLFMAVGLTPMLAFYWALLPLVWLFAYHLITGDEFLVKPRVRFALLFAILVEVGFTYLVYPIRSAMPPLMQMTMPLATGVVGALLAVYYTWRKGNDASLFGAFFVFAVSHGFLQVFLFILLRN